MSLKTLSRLTYRIFADLRLLRTHFFRAVCALIAIAGYCWAQSASTPYPGNANTLPEVMVVPIKVEGKVIEEGGWILTFRNQLRGSDAQTTEISSRIVTYRSNDKTRVQDQILWEITRTPNFGCREGSSLGCLDRIRVLAVPSGFIAVPQSGLVEEGGVLRIVIVPSGIV